MKRTMLVLMMSIAIIGCKESGSDSKPEPRPPTEEVTPVPETPPTEEIDVEEPVIEPEPVEPPVEEEEPIYVPDPEPAPEVPPIVEPEEPIEEEPAPVTDSATLSWTPPFTRVNGDKLHLYEISHYVVTHYFEDTVVEYDVGDYSSDEHTFYGLPSGVHIFEIRTVDTDGLISPVSESVDKTIP